MKIILILLAMAVTAGGAFHTYTTRNHYINAAFLSEAFTLMAPLKMQVADYYLQTGSMPHSNEEAGLAAPNAIFGTSVKRVAINRGGVVQVDFDLEFGKSSMTFTPTAGLGTGSLSWRCTSDSIDPSVLDKLRPTCSFLPLTNESQLMKGIANRSVESIDQALMAGADVNSVVNGNTALMLAAKLGDPSIINRLIDEGADIDHLGINADRRTPLMVAITSNRSESVATLLSHGASVQRTDYQGKSALDYARDTDARLGGDQYVLMVAARLNPNFAGQSASALATPARVNEERRLRDLYVEMRSAAYECHSPRLSSILADEDAYPEGGLIDGKPLKSHVSKPECSVALTDYVESLPIFSKALYARLSSSLRQCDSTQVQSLMRDNPTVDLMSKQWRKASLFEDAVFSGCAEIVAMLIREHSLSGSIDDQLLSEVIERAPPEQMVRLVGSLIEARVDVNAASQSGTTALAASIAAEQPVIAKYLIDAGADVNVQTRSGSYPLIDATKKGYSHLVSQLLRAGAELNVADQMGRSAIISAVAQGKLRMVDLLLRSGANPLQRDNNGISAVILAESGGHRAIHSLLTSSASNE